MVSIQQLESSLAFKYGVAGVPNDADIVAVYGQEVVDLYNSLPKETFSLDLLHSLRHDEYSTDLWNNINADEVLRSPFVTAVNFSARNLRHCIAKEAKDQIRDLPNNPCAPDRIDGLVAAALHDSLPDTAKKTLSLDLLYLLRYVSGDNARTCSSLKKVAAHPEADMTGDMISSAAVLAQAVQGSIAAKAKNEIWKLAVYPCTPDRIDGLIAAAALSTEAPYKGRNLWGYHSRGTEHEDFHKKVTLKSFSTSLTVHETPAEIANFRMFKSGRTKLECVRFSFVDASNPKGGNPDEYNPLSIDKNFLAALKLDAGLVDRLPVHAKRLAMVQWVLKDLVRGTGPLTHILFEYVLGYLVKEMESSGSEVYVQSLAAMEEMEIMVQVCNEYLELQGKAPKSGDTGKDAMLNVKSDIVVGKVCQGNERDRPLVEQFVYGLYSIEIEHAHGMLKHSGIRQKSQLVSASLARSLRIEADGKKYRNVLFSVLCDSCCLYILVHFRKERVAYLSHREVEPGRMISILAWLHTISKQEDFTLEDFKKESFLTIGGSFEEELDAAQKKRKSGAGQDQAPLLPGKRTRVPTKEGSSKWKAAICDTIARGAASTYLDFDAGDEREEELKQQQRLETFSALLNRYHFGHELPLTNNMLELLHSEEIKSPDETNMGSFGIGRKMSVDSDTF